MWFGPASECYLDMTRGTWEPGVTRLFDRLITSGMTVVDAGAHVGYFTLLAARKVGPDGRVYAFEPAAENFTLLLRNIALNGYRNTFPMQIAISDKDGESTLYLYSDSVGHSLYPETTGSSRATQTIRTTTLDRFFEEEGWPPVQLIKLDIEGAEPAALEGMTGLRRRNQDLRIVVEYVPHILQSAGRNPHRFLERIRQLGFTIQVIRDDGRLEELTSEDADRPGARLELFCEPEIVA
jgi:FkbM family methyltransferase